MTGAASSLRLCRRLTLPWVLAGAWTVPAAVAQTVFSDAFETGRVCRWSIAQPFVGCASYQTCAEAAGETWGCFEMPHLGTPIPQDLTGDWVAPGSDRADVYVLFDRSGDMSAESNSLRNNLSTVRNNITCPPAGSGTPGTCYPDLWMGAGVINYAGTTPSFQNVLDLQPNPSFGVVPSTEPTGCCNETALLSTWAAVTGQGSATSGCTTGAFAARSSCVGSPADTAGYATFGYPCFRAGGVAMVVLPMSEDPTGTLQCPSSATLIAAATGAGARILGLLGSGAPLSASGLLEQLASGTGAVDRLNGDAPLVISGPDAQAATAVQNLLLTARSLLRHASVAAALVDDPGDGVDVVAAFVDHLETFDGAPGCTTGLAVEDRDLDTYPDTYLEVPLGSTLCFRVVASANTTVPPNATTETFPASLTLTLDNAATPAASLPVVFLVPSS